MCCSRFDRVTIEGESMSEGEGARSEPEKGPWTRRHTVKWSHPLMNAQRCERFRWLNFVQQFMTTGKRYALQNLILHSYLMVRVRIVFPFANRIFDAAIVRSPSSRHWTTKKKRSIRFKDKCVGEHLTACSIHFSNFSLSLMDFDAMVRSSVCICAIVTNNNTSFPFTYATYSYAIVLLLLFLVRLSNMISICVIIFEGKAPSSSPSIRWKLKHAKCGSVYTRYCMHRGALQSQPRATCRSSTKSDMYAKWKETHKLCVRAHYALMGERERINFLIGRYVGCGNFCPTGVRYVRRMSMKQNHPPSSAVWTMMMVAVAAMAVAAQDSDVEKAWGVCVYPSDNQSSCERWLAKPYRI